MENKAANEIEKRERSFPLIKFGFVRYPDEMSAMEIMKYQTDARNQDLGIEHPYTSQFYDGMIITAVRIPQQVVEDIFHAIWEDEMLEHNGGFTANHEFKLGYQYLEVK